MKAAIIVFLSLLLTSSFAQFNLVVRNTETNLDNKTISAAGGKAFLTWPPDNACVFLFRGGILTAYDNYGVVLQEKEQMSVSDSFRGSQVSFKDSVLDLPSDWQFVACPNGENWDVWVDSDCQGGVSFSAYYTALGEAMNDENDPGTNTSDSSSCDCSPTAASDATGDFVVTETVTVLAGESTKKTTTTTTTKTTNTAANSGHTVTQYVTIGGTSGANNGITKDSAQLPKQTVTVTGGDSGATASPGGGGATASPGGGGGATASPEGGSNAPGNGNGDGSSNPGNGNGGDSSNPGSGNWDGSSTPGTGTDSSNPGSNAAPADPVVPAAEPAKPPAGADSPTPAKPTIWWTQPSSPWWTQQTSPWWTPAATVAATSTSSTSTSTASKSQENSSSEICSKENLRFGLAVFFSTQLLVYLFW